MTGVTSFSGCSAGALVAAGLCLDIDFTKLSTMAIEMAIECRDRPYRAAQLKKYINHAITTHLGSIPEAEVLARVNGRLAVGVTSLPTFKHVVIREFTSMDHLHDVLLASACMFPLAGKPVKLDKYGYCIDGGYSKLIPAHASNDVLTVTVFPQLLSSSELLSGNYIRPSSSVPVHWAAYPTTSENLKYLFSMGVTDTMQWLSTHVVSQTLSPLPPVRRQVRQIVSKKNDEVHVSTA